MAWKESIFESKKQEDEGKHIMSKFKLRDCGCRCVCVGTYWIAEAWTWINKWPSCTSGLGTSSRVRTGGLEGSGRVRTRAFIVDMFNFNFEISVLA